MTAKTETPTIRKEALQDYMEEHPSASARIQQGGWTHTGTLTPPNTGHTGQYATVRDSRMKGYRQRQSVFDRHLEGNYPRLEIKVDRRYVPVRQVLGLD